jgi:hypothetical protein
MLYLVEYTIDSGGELADLGKSVGQDLLDSSKMDLFPMPHTCETFGVLEAPEVLTAIRLKSQEMGITAEVLDELAKTPSPKAGLLRLLGLS